MYSLTQEIDLLDTGRYTHLNMLLNCCQKQFLMLVREAIFTQRYLQRQDVKLLALTLGLLFMLKKKSINWQTILIGDFNAMIIKKKYDLVWASHVLEHQQNVGMFI